MLPCEARTTILSRKTFAVERKSTDAPNVRSANLSKRVRLGQPQVLQLMNYQDIQENIFKRLGAVDVSSGVVDKATVGRALDQYLHTLKLTRRPITWVKDAQHACHLAAQIDPAFVKGELHDRIFEVFRHTAEREHQVWAYPRAWAIEAGYGRQLRMVKALVSGNSGQLIVLRGLAFDMIPPGASPLIRLSMRRAQPPNVPGLR